MVVFSITGLGAFWRSSSRAATPPSTPTSELPFTTRSSFEAAPQLPTASRPRTHSRPLPGGNGPVASAADTASVGEANAPLIGVPAPAAAGLVPNDHSAATTFDPPEVASETVAVRVAGRLLSIGFGLDTIDPAITLGPSASPPGRLIVNVASLTSKPLSDGDPLSLTVTRTTTTPLLGTALMSQL